MGREYDSRVLFVTFIDKRKNILQYALWLTKSFGIICRLYLFKHTLNWDVEYILIWNNWNIKINLAGYYSCFYLTESYQVLRMTTIRLYEKDSRAFEVFVTLVRLCARTGFTVLSV